MEIIMTKKEFISQLKDTLEGMVPATVLHENIQYYEKYFYEKISEGKTEAEISEELGNPRLIGKSIIEANGNQQIYYDEEPEEKEESYTRTRVYTADSRKFKIGCAITVFLILVALIAIFKVVLTFLGPIFIIGIVIYFIYQILHR